MSIPDAPWVGKCREDYYGYKEETVYCESCGRELDRDLAKRLDGEYYCHNCYDHYFGEDEEEDEEYEEYEEYEEDEDASSV